MKKLRVKYPFHLILGYFTIALGLILIFNDHFYFWPPDQAPFYNSDFVGSWALFSGAGVIYVAFEKKLPVKANFLWLLSECGFLGFETGLEFAHGVVSHNAHMLAFSAALFGFLLVAFTLIRTGVTPWLDSKAKERLEAREQKMKEGR